MSAMRGQRWKSSPLLVILTLVASLLLPSTAPALAFKSAPATKWGLIQASPGNSERITAEPRQAKLEGERKSEWRVKFVGFPEEAKSAVEYAVEIWSRSFESKVPVNVEATWGDYRTLAVLGSARPGFFFSSFLGAPDDTLWYPSALANALAGKDLNPGQEEIVLKVNSRANWYLGTDGRPSEDNYDLVSVVLHEIAHGLGFTSNAEFDRFFGTGYMFQPSPFDAYTQIPDGRSLADFCSRSAELGRVMRGQLQWSGEEGVKANGGVKPKLYSPADFEDGSSITHLDEGLFSNSSTDSMMTPNLEAGEVFRAPGPIVLGMIADMLRKPPISPATESPAKPANVKAIVGDRYALITLESSTCRRLDRITGYSVRTFPGGKTAVYTSAPIRVTGLKNGTSYTFEVSAQNSKGLSEPVETNSVKPESTSAGRVVDLYAKVSEVATTKSRGNPMLIYGDARTQTLKSATLVGNKWRLATIRKEVNVGKLSICKSGEGAKEQLHVIYADLTRQDLLYSNLRAGKWVNSTIDGNGVDIQDYRESVRRQTASDVSVSNACAVARNTLQVFYRDESQGILLGAVKTKSGWIYEIVDGDRDSDNRTTGDVAFNLSAISHGDSVYLLYDSVLTINSNKAVTEGEVRLASRSDIFPEDWGYLTVDGTNSSSSIAGFATALAKQGEGIYGAWLRTSVLENSGPAIIRISSLVGNAEDTVDIEAPKVGKLGSPLLLSQSSVVFSCEQRLCSSRILTKKPQLLTSIPAAANTGALVEISKRLYLATSISSQLRLILIGSK